MNAKMTGYVMGALAAASYGTNPLFALPMLNAGVDASSVLFVRYVLAIPMLAAIMLVRGRGFGLRRSQWLPMVVMGVLMALSSLLLYVSYAYIGAAIASTLLFVYPILVTVIMAVFYHERATLSTVVCIVLASTGIALLYRGGDGQSLSPVGLLLVFLSALTYAVYLVAVNTPRLKVVPTLKLTLYVIFFGTFLFLPNMRVETFTLMNSHPHLWLCGLGMAFFPTAFSLICTSAAIQRVGSTPVAIMGALEPVTAVAIAVLLFDEQLTPRLALGMSLVILAVTIIIAGGSAKAALLRVRQMFPSLRRRR